MKIQSTYEPERARNYNEWAIHIHNELDKIRQKLGGLSYQRKEAGSDLVQENGEVCSKKHILNPE